VEDDNEEVKFDDEEDEDDLLPDDEVEFDEEAELEDEEEDEISDSSQDSFMQRKKYSKSRAKQKSKSKSKMDRVVKPPKAKSRPLAKRTVTKKNSPQDVLSISSDSSVESIEPPPASASRSKSKTKPTISKFFITKSTKVPTRDVPDVPPPAKKKKSSRIFDSDSDSDSDLAQFLAASHPSSINISSSKTSSSSSKLKKKKASSSSSSSSTTKTSSSHKSKRNRILIDTDDEDDHNEEDYGTDDENVALALAMSESLKDAPLAPPMKQSVMKSHKKKAIPEKNNDNDDDGMIGFDEEEEEEEDVQDIEEHDEYKVVDQDEREATKVLNAANKLSKYIVQVLNAWMNDASGNSGVAQGGAVCVDGVISLSSMGGGGGGSGSGIETTNSDGSTTKNTKVGSAAIVSQASSDQSSDQGGEDSGFISKEIIKKVCPNVKCNDFQHIGVNWLALLNRLQFDLKDDGGGGGNDDSVKEKKRKRKTTNVNGVLADEMGLGKTVQTIVFLAWLKYQKYGLPKNNTQDDDIITLDDSDNDSIGAPGPSFADHKPHIIIVPASILANWQREFEKFCPHFSVVKYHGTQDERSEIRESLQRRMSSKRGSRKGPPVDVVLTTFSYFSSEKGDDRNFLRKFDWDYMVVDEAHCLKNPKGARYRNMDKFITERRLLLTGTPVQNNPQELMSLLCFLMPVFNQQIRSDFHDDDEGETTGGAHMLEFFVQKTNDGEGGDQSSDEVVYKKLKKLLAPFVLRRTKDTVLHQMLPEKARKEEIVAFDKEARQVYESIQEAHKKAKAEKDRSSEMYGETHVFTSLRKAANNPLLLRTRHKSQEEIEHLSTHLRMYGFFGNHETLTQELVKKQLQTMSDFDIHSAAYELIAENKFRENELGRYILDESDLFCSPKLTRLQSILPELIKDGHRMLIFSQWTRCLDLIECLLGVMGLKYLRFDGQTKISERQILVDEFTNDTSIPIFLLSTRAGGMGINLTAADVCILHDLDFNPFNDLQAEDRCHRIGQTKPVTIIKMVTENSVDEMIHNMQKQKAEMNKAILENGKAPTKNSESQDMKAVLRMALSRFQDD